MWFFAEILKKMVLQFDFQQAQSYNACMKQINDDILTRCKTGDREAFRILVHTYQRMVFSLSLKMMCDEDDAKDCVQDVFLKVWQNIAGFDSRVSMSTWIYTIASHICLDKLKKKRRMSPLPDDESVFREYTEKADAQTELENRQWVAVVRILAEGLSGKQKLVFTLCQLEGLDSSEVQEITGLDAKQIKSNLYAARQIIRKRLKDMGYE